MHNWSEKSVDWIGLNNAAEYIGTSLIKYGRMNVMDYKEKWGTVRVYVSFGWWQIHDITHPGHSYNRYPKWLWRLDCNYGYYAVFLPNLIAVPYHKFLYKLIYTKAIKKWPHLTEEILNGADHWDLLKGIK
jgi:hypothetical protein